MVQVTSPHLKTIRDNEVDGIKLDEFGNPFEYHVSKEHPGSLFGDLNLKFDRIPGSSVFFVLARIVDPLV